MKFVTSTLVIAGLLFGNINSASAVTATSSAGIGRPQIPTAVPGFSFNYSASSPSSPLLPTINNSCTQLSIDPMSNMGSSASTDIAVASLRLNSAVIGAEDVWTDVPLSIDLIIQDAETGTYGYFEINGTISGVTKIGKSMLDARNFNVFPSALTFGGKTYVVLPSPFFFNAPGASSLPGIDGGARGTISVRVSATRANNSRVASTALIDR